MYHFIGIGGAGMSAVAELLATDGHRVSGSDSLDSPTLTHLNELGITTWVGHDAAHISDGMTVVVSTAIRENNPELVEARKRGLEIIHRSNALALAAAGMSFVAVAGAHGKTTTTSMLAVALREAGLDPSYAIGGSVVGLGAGAHRGTGKVFIAEADESDRSFLNYSPRIAVVTNIEPDHLDFYGSEEAFRDAFVQFAHRIVPGGLLIACDDDPGAAELRRRAVQAGIRTLGYGFDGEHLTIGEGTFTIDGSTYPINLRVKGTHNSLNAAAAFATGLELGVPAADMLAGLEAFRGAGRRFESHGTHNGVSVVDDYAHHPTEVAATLTMAQDITPGRVLVLFQPHLYSRTVNFSTEFAKALDLADQAIVTSIYASREDPIEGVTSELITSKMNKGIYVADRHEAAATIARMAEPRDLVITMGAGDVTLLADEIVNLL